MFGTLCRGIAAVSVAMALAAAAPLPTPLEQLDAALHELAPNGADFTVATVPAQEQGPFARARVDRIEIDPAALALVNDRQSARALAALLLSYYAMPDPGRFNTNPLKVGEITAAAGAIVLGTRVVDPIDRKQFSNSTAPTVGYGTTPVNLGQVAVAAAGAVLGADTDTSVDRKRPGYEDEPRFELGWFPPTPEESGAGAVRASRMLAILGQSGGCSGPLTDLLGRAEKLGDREATTLSRRVRKDLGKSIYPPDYSCAG